QAEDSDANSLNNKEITTIIRRNGFRFWGNRTPETNAYIFEVYIVKARRQLNALNQLQRTGTVLSEKQQKLMQQLSTRLERLNES
ncbi:hypothetical protein U9697_24685, partial [Escherichia coli]